MDADFDALVEDSRDAHNRTGLQALWRTAIGLPEWYFVADQSGDDAEPIVAAFDDKPHLLVFTDEARATAFSEARAAKRESDPTPTLSMTVAEASDYIRTMANHVAGVLFNTGENGFAATPTAVVDAFNRYKPG